MTNLKTTLLAACLGLASAASVLAADLDSESARQQRMDQALESYRGAAPAADQQGEDRDARRSEHRRMHREGHGPMKRDGYRAEDDRNPNPGPAARTENAIKRGAHRAGTAVKHGAETVGHAVKKGVHKTGDALDRGEDKAEDAVKPKP